MIKIEIDDVTVNNTSSILSFLFCHLFSFFFRISINKLKSLNESLTTVSCETRFFLASNASFIHEWKKTYESSWSRRVGVIWQFPLVLFSSSKKEELSWNRSQHAFHSSSSSEKEMGDFIMWQFWVASMFNTKDGERKKAQKNHREFLRSW